MAEETTDTKSTTDTESTSADTETKETTEDTSSDQESKDASGEKETKETTEDTSDKDASESDEDIEDEPLNPDEIEIETRKPAEEDDESSEAEDDEDIDEEEKDKISKVVESETRDIRSENKKLQDQLEVTNFLEDNPDMRRYRDVMLKYMAHPAYSNIPAKNIARIVAGRDLMKLGAKKEREAREKTEKTKDSGTQTKDVKTGEPNWLEASDEQYRAKLKEIRGY